MIREELKNLAIQLFCTKIGWLVICGILFILFGTMSNWYPWAVYVMFASLAYPVALSIIMMVYAWVINPIRNRKIRA